MIINNINFYGGLTKYMYVLKDITKYIIIVSGFLLLLVGAAGRAGC